MKLHDEYADRGLLVIGVTEETVGAVFVWSRDVGWTGKIPVAVDENARLRRMFGVTTYPTTAVVDTEGVLRWIAAGATEADVRAQVEQYLLPATPKDK